MNYINDYALEYHEQLIKLSNEVSEICEDSRYVLGKYADIRWDILMMAIREVDNWYESIKIAHMNLLKISPEDMHIKDNYDKVLRYTNSFIESIEKRYRFRKGLVSSVVFMDEARELSEEDLKILDDYIIGIDYAKDYKEDK